MIYAVGTSTITGDLDATQRTNVFGVTTFIGELIAGGGVSFTFGISTFSASLAAIGTNLGSGFEEASSGLSIGSAQHRFYEVTPRPVMQGALLVTAITTASGTITVTGDLAADGKQLAQGTSTFIGNLVCAGISLGLGVGTSTITGDLVSRGTTNASGTITALGQGLSEGTHLAAGTITITGDLDADGKNQAAGTITATGDLAADGKNLAQGTSTITGDLAADGKNLAQGTSTFIGDLAAIGTDLTSLTEYGIGTITFSGDLVADGTSRAFGTSTIAGDLTADGISRASGTITVSGDLVSRGTTNASGTITALGQGLSEGTHLAAGTITITGDLVAAGTITVTNASGTITITGEGAASGTQLAGGVSTFSGQLVAVGTDISAAGVVPPGQSIFQSTIPLPRNQSVIPTGIQALPGQPPAKGIIRVIGSLRAQTGNVQVSGTITVVGSLSAAPPVDLFNIASVTLFTDEVPIPPSFVFLHSGPPLSRVAAGSIVVSGDLSVADDITQFAFATITVIGDVATASEGVVNAAGTITATGDLAALGVKTIVSVTATITVFGTADSRAGLIQETATVGVKGQLSALGTALTPTTLVSGTITATGRLEAIPIKFCPISVAGTISVSGSLVALEEPTDDIVTVSGSVRVVGRLRASLYHYAAGGNKLAQGTITVAGSFDAYMRKVTCITPTATILMSGATLSAGFTDSNLFLKFATMTITGTLTVSAIYAKASQLNIPGELTALGRNLPFGHLAILSDEAALSTFGQIGPGTIDGQKKAIIFQDYGSLELYNNSQGGFYSIGNEQQLKEAFTLINYAADLRAKGSRDQTLYGRGAMTFSSNVAAIGNHTSVSASIGISVAVSATEGATNAFGTSTFIGDLAVIGSHEFAPTYNGAQSPTLVAFTESNWEYFDFGPGSSDAEGEHDIYFMSTTPTLPVPIPYVPNGEIWTVGDVNGGDIDNGSSAWPLTNIFSLMQNPDTVKIRLVSAVYSDSDHATHPSTVIKIGTFTDNVEFAPVDDVHYGYRALTNVSAHSGGPVQNSGQIIPIVEFTFKKAGYTDLVVTYKVESSSSAQAEESNEEPEE